MFPEMIRNAYYRLPDGIQRAILVKRRERIWIEAGIVFIHIPKAAGTSINEALFGRFMGHVRASDIERWGSGKLRALPSFAVTRNPWDRLVSAYRFARRGRGIGGEIQAGVRQPQRYQTRQFETFQSFVKEWLVKHDLAALDGIFQPQCAFISDDCGKLLVDHVGRVEDLAPTLDFIGASTGREVHVQRSNRSGEGTDYRSFYTSELVTLVESIYRRDVELFGYDF